MINGPNSLYCFLISDRLQGASTSRRSAKNEKAAAEPYSKHLAPPALKEPKPQATKPPELAKQAPDSTGLRI
jgi:hypothetical protein